MLHHLINTYNHIVNKVCGILPELNSEALADSHAETSQSWSEYLPTETLNSIKELLENPDPWTIGLASGITCFGGGYLLYKSYRDALMMNEFKDQNDIARLLTFYENNSKARLTLGSFNNRIIFKISELGLFQAIPYIVLDDNAIQQDILSKTIVDWMMDILAFTLLKGLSVEEFRCFIPINHLNLHWTALNINITLSQEGKNKLEQIRKKYYKKHQINNDFHIDYNILNQAKNFLLELLCPINPYGLPFSSETKLVHQDSLNATVYNQNVYISLLPYLQNNAGEYTFKSAQQQEANTCAEHTARNGIYYGLYKAQPEITESKKLRQLTNYLCSRPEYTLHR